jgi:hypothetical protein
MRDLKFICVQPDDNYFVWQVNLWLESLRELGKSDQAIVLIFTPSFREQNPNWKQIVDMYPESKFHFYKDVDNVSDLFNIYIPVLRPYTLWKFYKEFPEMSEKAMFYCDCDILFTKNFNIDAYIENDINYLSDTNSYTNSDYFESKLKDVLPDKLEEYKAMDVLGVISSIIGLDKETIIKNKNHAGGAQYLLKRVDHTYWAKVMNDCILIRTYFQKINRDFFASEDKGIQSWCADMWAVVWNLWVRDLETKVIPEMNFAWSVDLISKLDTCNILHNAGVSSDFMPYPCFHKGKYHTGKNPQLDSHIDVILNSEESKKYCTYFYTQQLKKLTNLKYK